MVIVMVVRMTENEMTQKNPFEYEAANNLPTEKIASYFIDDFNYSRFINSPRNVVLVGDRGSGKTMALMFNSIAVQLQLSNVVPERIGIYVPCKTMLMQKKEQDLIEEGQYSSILSEHFLTMSVLYNLVDQVSKIPEIAGETDDRKMRQEVTLSIGFDLTESMPVFDALRHALNREAYNAQVALNANATGKDPSFHHEFPALRTFGTSVLPLLETLRSLPRLEGVHFMVMLDDIHDLNDAQVKAVNSWIAYRDHSYFSVKTASARLGQPHFKTSVGGTILDGHDFIEIDLEQAYQNEESNFAKLAKKLVTRRLQGVGIDSSPEEFFPVNKTFAEQLEKCRIQVRKRAQRLFPNGPETTVNDYVYRFTRAEWFRQRPRHANLPAYSGFQTLIYLSTGVIRNLLEPCYWMFDDAMSATSEPPSITHIDPRVQREKIIDRSKKIWQRLESADRFVEGCSRSDAKKLYSLFEQLTLLFRKRLEKHESEPGAISFTISAMSEADENVLFPLLEIARAAQVLYVRSGAGKGRGRRENYYVPNRMLWPSRGLDPHGQHARVSIKAEHLRAAAEGEPIPFDTSDQQGSSVAQERLF